MKTHIFGELDLDLSKGPGKIWDEVFRISEICGYYPTLRKSGQIMVEGSDNDVATICFDKNGNVEQVFHYANDDDGNRVIPLRKVKIE